MTNVPPPVPEQPVGGPPPYSPMPPAYQPTQPAYPGGQPTGYYAPPPTNTMAIVAFVLVFVVSLGAIICGHIALSQIKRTGEGGRGFALAAVIIGYASLALSVIIVVIWVIFALIIGAAALSNCATSSYCH